MSYGRLARGYAFCERLAFASVLQQVREQYVEDLCRLLQSPDGSLLIVGGGDGRFLEALLRSGVQARVDYVECSQGMIRVARKRIEKAGLDQSSVNWVEQRFEQWQGVGYDVVVAHFFIDNFEGEALAAVHRKLAHSVGRGGVLVVSDFDPDRSVGAKVCVWVMQFFFWITCGLKPKRFHLREQTLREAGLRLLDRRLRIGGWVYTTKWKK